MRSALRKFLLVAIVLTLATSARGQNVYSWLTDIETRPFGPDDDYQPFGPFDGINGIVRSNDTITIAGSPVFDWIITHAPLFEHGPDYNPTFNVPPTFNASLIGFPEYAENLRNYATHYFNPGSDKQMRMVINGSTLHHFTWDLGEAFDSLECISDQIEIPQGEGSGLCVFTETRLELAGTEITGRITIGSAQQIRLMDDVRVGVEYTSGPPEYRIQEWCPHYIGIVSEGDIKIANTPRNGRENSSGMGMEQPNQAYTDIIIHADMIALGSFEFEQQNDPDSGYVCDCSPDWRGDIWFWGALQQCERSYLSRTNNGGTGYRLHHRFDTRLLMQRPPCFFSPIDSSGGPQTTDTLFFGEVAVGTTVWDTAHVYPMMQSYLGAVIASYPFYAERIEPFWGTHFTIPVSFTPAQTGQYTGMLNVSTSYHYYQIVLRGTGIPGSAPPIAEPSVYPNPFNAVTTLTFELESAGVVKLELYNTLGQLVATPLEQSYEAGRHHAVISAADLPSGVYFARLTTPTQHSMHKLLLIR